MSDLKFYSLHGCKEQNINCVLNKLNEKNINLPCIILVRKENWNDGGFYSHFKVYYIPKLFEINDLGITKIIEPKYNINKATFTDLPVEFPNLSTKFFLSRGTINFYNQLKKNIEIKDLVLKSLNDIHYRNLTMSKIIAINKDYKKPLDASLFREDLGYDISSEYAINASNILENIKDIAVNIDDKLQKDQIKILKKLLYGTIITSLEAYLGDAFKFKVLNNKDIFDFFYKIIL
ncbi:MAG: hypothetical protein PHR48_03615 [Candidatus ainarchaeum sp.]|nr:hypothetical protein [Candidatus ainarchaeum sp.]